MDENTNYPVPIYLINDDYIDPSSWPALTKLIEHAPETTESDGTDPEPMF